MHLSGPGPGVVDDPDEALAIIRRASIDVTEALRPAPAGTPARLARISSASCWPAITAFEITVEEVRSTFKLSQDKPAETQHRVHTSFAASTHGRDRELGGPHGRRARASATPPGSGEAG